MQSCGPGRNDGFVRFRIDGGGKPHLADSENTKDDRESRRRPGKPFPACAESLYTDFRKGRPSYHAMTNRALCR